MVKQNNENKAVLYFNDQGLKYIFSENILDVLEKYENLPDLLTQYPQVREFLKSITLIFRILIP